MRTFWIGVAGFAGAVSRYQIEGWVGRRTDGSFPWATLMVNVSGCFLLGLLVTLFTARLPSHPNVRAALAVGFLGAYTTFSTFAYETLRLGQEGAPRLAGTNVIVSVAAGIVAAWAGTLVAKTL